MKTVAKDIITEMMNYQSRAVTIVPGFLFNQYQTINTNFFYYNSKFESGDTDEDGDRKYFFNITKNPCKIFSKSVDFDTKNIKLLTTGGGDPMKTWFMERDLKFWMRDKQFGKFLNRIFYELPIFGSVVIKILDGQPYFVDLRNFMVEQSADDLDSTNYIIELHHYTVMDFKKVAKQMKWPDSKVKETIARFRENKDKSHITVWERYGEIENDDGTYSWQRTFIADVEWSLYDLNRNLIGTERGIMLSSEDWDGHPYWEFHAEKMRGRWLGIGVVEALYEPQIRQNELANLQAKASYFAALRIFQTRDAAINRNMLTDVKNGEVLSADSIIEPVDMADRNLSYFNEETNKWSKNTSDLTIAFAPIGHSVIAIQVALDQVVSYFEQIQENIALDIKEMIYEAIIPSFQKESFAEHTVRLVGQDLDAFIELVKNDLTMKEVIRQITLGNFPTGQDRDMITTAIGETIKQGKEKIITIPKDFYKDIKFDVDIDITGESVDTKGQAATRLSILQAITADPTMTTDPIKKKILYAMAEDGGLDAISLFGTPTTTIDNAVNPQQVRAGGGVSAVKSPMGAPANSTTATV